MSFTQVTVTGTVKLQNATAADAAVVKEPSVLSFTGHATGTVTPPTTNKEAADG